MHMMFMWAKHDSAPNDIGLEHGGWWRISLSDGTYLFALRVHHPGLTRHQTERAVVDKSLTVDLFPPLGAGKQVSDAAHTSLTAHFGPLADKLPITALSAVYASMQDPMFSPEGLP